MSIIYILFTLFSDLANSISIWFASYSAQLHLAFYSLYEIKLYLTKRKLFLYGAINHCYSKFTTMFFRKTCNEIN